MALKCGFVGEWKRSTGQKMITNDEVSRRVNEQRNLLKENKKRQ